MQVILLVAGAAILGGAVWAALGRGGEMAMFPGDCAPLDVDELTAADVALLRPPQALWGYHVQATEEALRLIARSLTARDVEIASLRQELAGLRDSQPGLRGSQPGQRDSQPGLRGSQPGQRGSQPGLRGSQPGPGNSDPGRWPAPGLAEPPGPGERYLGRMPDSAEGLFSQRSAPGGEYLGQPLAPGDGYSGRPAVPGERNFGPRQVAGTDQNGGSLPPWPVVPGPGHDD